VTKTSHVSVTFCVLRVIYVVLVASYFNYPDDVLGEFMSRSAWSDKSTPSFQDKTSLRWRTISPKLMQWRGVTPQNNAILTHRTENLKYREMFNYWFIFLAFTSTKEKNSFHKHSYKNINLVILLLSHYVLLLSHYILILSHSISLLSHSISLLSYSV